MTRLEGWGLISYARSDGSWLHTANTPEGFRRKLTDLGRLAAMTQDANPEHRPYVLWKDALSNGHSATLLIWPRKDRAFAVLRLDDQFHSSYQFATHEQAIQKGWAIHQQVLAGKLDQLGD